MDKNFKVRTLVGFGMLGIAIVTLYTFEALPFKIFYGAFALMALIELLSFFHNNFSISRAFLAIVEIAFLICSAIFVAGTTCRDFWYVIFGVCGYDVFAYLFGKAFGGKIFKKSRPFPHISKNKTWEGTILGLLSAFGLMIGLMSVRGSISVDCLYLICAPLALIGDLFESAMKRTFKIKDSNEVVIKNKFFAKLELLIGGSEGHGGFLDRIDSVAFATTILLAIFLIF